MGKKDKGKKSGKKQKLQMLYIIGVPGAGKTTAIREALKGVPETKTQIPYVYLTEYAPGVVQLGWDRETFGGTDSLGMAAQPHVMAYLEEQRPRVVLAEGDRLANMKFFEGVEALGYELTVMVLDVDLIEAEVRREARNKAIGKAQNEGWLKTRFTKVGNLREFLKGKAVVIDANQKAKKVAREISAHPVMQEILALKS